MSEQVFQGADTACGSARSGASDHKRLTLDGNACRGEASSRAAPYGASVQRESPAMPGRSSPLDTAQYLYSAGPRTKGCGSVCVSFTPVPNRSPADMTACLGWSGTLAAGGERWCAVLESV
jgi:hypothetical protein